MTMEDDPEYRNGKSGQEERSANTNEVVRPFDTSELGKIPDPTDEDPPYRDWWVMKEHPGRPEPSPS
jgi:hypothetical protein